MYGADKAPESSLHRLCSMRSQQLATLDKRRYGEVRRGTDVYGADKAPESSLHRLCSMRSQQLATLDKRRYGLLRTFTDLYGHLRTAPGITGGTHRFLFVLPPAADVSPLDIYFFISAVSFWCCGL
ncbi:MAG: hypothetical protein E7050_01065 [Lentisphaerae bacterium]|nr:hypothetical protein [Lentisphaerota bacterium]